MVTSRCKAVQLYHHTAVVRIVTVMVTVRFMVTIR